MRLGRGYDQLETKLEVEVHGERLNNSQTSIIGLNATANTKQFDILRDHHYHHCSHNIYKRCACFELQNS